MKKYNVIKITAKIILIILITLTSVGAAILIGFNWEDYFYEESEGVYEEKAMGSSFFIMGMLWLFIDIIWVILFFILLKYRKRRNNSTCLINEI